MHFMQVELHNRGEIALYAVRNKIITDCGAAA
jgi:hypothetical protein